MITRVTTDPSVAQQLTRDLTNAARMATLTLEALSTAIGTEYQPPLKKTPYSLGLAWLRDNVNDFRLTGLSGFDLLSQHYDNPYITLVLREPSLLNLIAAHRRGEFVEALGARHFMADCRWIVNGCAAGVPLPVLLSQIMARLQDTRNEVYTFVKIFLFGLLTDEGRNWDTWSPFRDATEEDALLTALMRCAELRPELFFDDERHQYLVSRLISRGYKTPDIDKLYRNAFSRLSSLDNASLRVLADCGLLVGEVTIRPTGPGYKDGYFVDLGGTAYLHSWQSGTFREGQQVIIDTRLMANLTGGDGIVLTRFLKLPGGDN